MKARIRVADHDHLRLDDRFRQHAADSGKLVKYDRIRLAGRQFAELLAELCPSSPELTLAVNSVDLAVMQANAAVARH